MQRQTLFHHEIPFHQNLDTLGEISIKENRTVPTWITTGEPLPQGLLLTGPAIQEESEKEILFGKYPVHLVRAELTWIKTGETMKPQSSPPI